MELFKPEFGLAFWMFVAFLCLYFILAKYAWPVIIKSMDERADLIAQSLEELDMTEGVEVRSFTGLLMAFCHEVCAGGVVKGLRATTDFEYELQQADLNYRLSPGIESVFVMGSPEFGFVSSSIVRELAALGSDVSFLEPACVARALEQKFPKAR